MAGKLVVVTGATGTQGGAVVSALLKRGRYTIRGLTRSTDSSSAKELQSKGVEMVSADLADKDSLISAFKGAYAVFGNTVLPCKANDEAQGRNMVDACKANNVPLFVWSSIPSAIEASHGKYTDVYHWEQKYAVNGYISSVSQPAVILEMGGFLDNLVTQPGRFEPAEGDASTWRLSHALVPSDVKMSSIWIEGDFGNIVEAIVDHWDDEIWRKRLAEKPIPVASARIAPDDVGESIRRLTGKEVEVIMTRTPPGFPQPLISMFKLFGDGFYDFPGPNPPEILVELGVEFHTLDDFVKAKLVPLMHGVTDVSDSERGQFVGSLQSLQSTTTSAVLSSLLRWPRYLLRVIYGEDEEMDNVGHTKDPFSTSTGSLKFNFIDLQGVFRSTTLSSVRELEWMLEGVGILDTRPKGTAHDTKPALVDPEQYTNLHDDYSFYRLLHPRLPVSECCQKVFHKPNIENWFGDMATMALKNHLTREGWDVSELDCPNKGSDVQLFYKYQAVLEGHRVSSGNKLENHVFWLHYSNPVTYSTSLQQHGCLQQLAKFIHTDMANMTLYIGGWVWSSDLVESMIRGSLGFGVITPNKDDESMSCDVYPPLRNNIKT
ncbi:NAD(P)-binding protein [Calocera viscosa TUFC12733]|uniref:NAD(P)-binding protein n=1 Tax=Calocera viscosa (strain TUFC12733) TaxID=1330018 RepID=A0A167PQ78_CALVF|nr:NAD(P)-binding protein [Calocera viscosa TUFC12733]